MDPWGVAAILVTQPSGPWRPQPSGALSAEAVSPHSQLAGLPPILLHICTRGGERDEASCSQPEARGMGGPEAAPQADCVSLGLGAPVGSGFHL